MIGTAAALLGSSALSAGAGLIGGLFGKSASQSAADAQRISQQKVIDTTKGAVEAGQNDITDAESHANDILGQAGDKEANLYKPYVDAGTSSLADIQRLSGEGGPLSQQFSFGAKDLESDPGYQFAIEEGNKAIARAGSAKGNLFSTSTLKRISDYNVGTASTHFNDAFQRAQSTFDTNRSTALSRIGTLNGLAQLGLAGTSGTADSTGRIATQQSTNLTNSGSQRANLGLQGADITGRALTNQGNSQAAAIVGGQNAINSGVGSGLSAIQQFLMLRSLNGGGSGSGGSGGGGVAIPDLLGSAANTPAQTWPGTSIPRT